MLLEEEIKLFGTWGKLHFTENKGMAFGMEWGGDLGKVFLTLFRIVACIMIGYYLRNLMRLKANQGLIICIALILAGALGNIIDSIFYGVLFNETTWEPATLFAKEGYASLLHGHVVDMLYFPMFEFTWPSWMPLVGGNGFMFFRPIFNIADTAISVGVITIIVFHKRYFKNLSLDDVRTKSHEEEELTIEVENTSNDGQ